MKKLKLIDKKILITGGSSGIGWDIAQTLINYGAEVTVISRRHPSEWEKGPLKNWDQKKQLIRADIRNVPTLIKKLEKWLELNEMRIDVLIQSAITYGVGSRHSLLNTYLEEWENIFMTNARGQFAIIKTLLPVLMKQPSALIVGIESDVVFKLGPGRIAYAASKSATHSLHSGLAEELKDSTVNVLELYPERGVATPGIKKRRPEGFIFSSNEYDRPNLFSEPLVPIIEMLGKGLSGTSLVVRNNKLIPIDVRKLK